MTLKNKLCEAFDWIKNVEGYTYPELMTKTGMTRSQVYNVLHHQGKGVSSDKIWDALLKLDDSTKIELYSENERLIP
ncbi:hypothetical protein NVP1084O_145 [Vibrio phage 1.084.O._10N.261.49.F5]|nr:hypothetical protein NVP1084O_145 [Vibrio phage 1.084.O._10N.261.49.F5]